ncbi:MAG: hypothetical protein A3G30_00300 [Chlamydiae bacterium RIFCSPLOWO2_12_FULL_49_12]|nr:MAG: hypothetical protein A3E26_01920 [Chlamydiae bacterium RIFCSPHIGHO2_12_FULL_49_32]OGN71586.1 MAG: hypothetical protein A3G30_00300 [Chlamydiae bacterium RIFCSPLOWO2_12_FULL_49_12]
MTNNINNSIAIECKEVAVDVAPSEDTFCGYLLSYDEIAKEHGRSLSGNGDKKIRSGAGGDYRKFLPRQRDILLEVEPRVVLMAVFKILAQCEGAKVPSSILGKRTWIDLNILSGNGKYQDRYLGSLVSRTDTQLGRAYLLGILARPTADRDVLEKRQAIVKEMVNNSTLYERLHTELKDSAADESHLLSFWNQYLQLPGTMNKQYFQYEDDSCLGRMLNNSPAMLSVKSSYVNFRKISNACTEIASSVLLPAFGIWTAVQFFGFLGASPQALEDYAARFTAASSSTGPLFAGLLLLAQQNLLATAGVTLAAGGLIATGLRSTLGWCKADIQSEALVQNKLVQVATYYKHTKNVYRILSEHPDLAEKFEHFSDLRSFATAENPRLKALFEMLETATFEEKREWFFSRGGVLLCFQLLQDEEMQELLGRGLNAVAEVDAFLSISALYNEYKEKRVHYCFPLYEKKDSPHFSLENFWNPFVDVNQAVQNSVEMGGENRRNAVVTGPNSSGKSTTIKGIALSMMIAQSFGIAPADKMAFTPFSHLATYMDITDDISNKASLFQSEIQRAVELCRVIEELGDAGFTFSMFDELFSGTSPNEGMAMAYALAKRLGSYQNSVSLLATHYAALTRLETDTNDFSNYKTAVAFSSSQRIERPFSLERGISKQRIALAVAREQGVHSKIVDDAEELLNGME